jgi:succinate dehydrogenase (ubiquinone) iron-sulfur subunit
MQKLFKTVARSSTIRNNIFMTTSNQMRVFTTANAA